MSFLSIFNINFKHQFWWQAHCYARVGQNYYERPKSKFWTFLIKSSMIVLKSAFPKPFWSPNSIFKLYIFYTNIQRFVVCVFQERKFIYFLHSPCFRLLFCLPPSPFPLSFHPPFPFLLPSSLPFLLSLPSLLPPLSFLPQEARAQELVQA